MTHDNVASSDTPDESLLKGQTILIVEDSLLIALECESLMLEFGAQNILIAANTANASTLMETNTIDLAVLDFNLGKETSISIAETLLRDAVPIIFATGYGEGLSLPEEFQNASRTISKPYTQADLKQAILTLLKS